MSFGEFVEGVVCGEVYVLDGLGMMWVIVGLDVW